MTKQYDDTNRGALFTNERRETEKHPNYTGSLNVDGHDYWLSAWVKEGRNGKFLSVAVKRKDGKPREATRDDRQSYSMDKPVRGESAVSREPEQGRRASLKDDLDDFIPFAPEFR